MADVNGIALMWAICAVDDKVAALAEQIGAADENNPDLPDLEDQLLSYMNTATDLRHAYEVACRERGNLKAYEKLVRKHQPSSSA